MRREQLAIDDESGSVELSYIEWGDPLAARVVLCVHGLTRNARDFDMLAARLAPTARVISVDMVGRGGSSWLDDPAGYVVPAYARHILALLDRLGIEEVDWVGTSMGGLIAMAVAAGERQPLRRLVLNDIGPFVPKAALGMIRDYLGLDLAFASLDELETHLRLIHAPFGPLTDAQWHHLAAHSARRDGDRLRLHYDPAIRVPFAADANADIDLWHAYECIACPTLLLRGAESVILDAVTADAMTRRGPKAELVTINGVGHAPALMDDVQIEAVARFLEA